MLLRNRRLLLVSVIALAGSVACTAPAPPSYGKTAKTSAGLVYNARSSQASTTNTGGGSSSSESAFAVGICRRVTVSRMTQVRACTHY